MVILEAHSRALQGSSASASHQRTFPGDPDPILQSSTGIQITGARAKQTVTNRSSANLNTFDHLTGAQLKFNWVTPFKARIKNCPISKFSLVEK